MFDLGKISLPGFQIPNMFPDSTGGVGDFIGKLPNSINHLAGSIQDGLHNGVHEAVDLINYSENKILSPIKNNLIDSIGDNALKSSFAIAGISAPVVIGGLVLLFVVVKLL